MNKTTTVSPDVSVQILQLRDCTRVDNVRALLQHCLAKSGLRASILESEGPYPSPTLLINGIDVTGHRVPLETTCRLDLPTEEQIDAALARTMAFPAFAG